MRSRSPFILPSPRDVMPWIEGISIDRVAHRWRHPVEVHRVDQRLNAPLSRSARCDLSRWMGHSIAAQLSLSGCIRTCLYFLAVFFFFVADVFCLFFAFSTTISVSLKIFSVRIRKRRAIFLPNLVFLMVNSAYFHFLVVCFLANHEHGEAFNVKVKIITS